MDVRPITGRVGAEVWGLDVERPLPAASLDALRRVLAERSVVVLRGQDVGPDCHLALARQLGPIRMPPDYFPTLPGMPEVGVLLTGDGEGNVAEQWHADVSWSPAPPVFSVLNMRRVPPAGGDTLWASQCEAHDRLSPAMQAFLRTLSAEHRLDIPGGGSAVHPVVHRHPVTGRHALFVNPGFTQRIVELAPDESATLLAFLYERVAAHDVVCRWRWSVGDIAIWDNHFVLHSVAGDYEGAREINRIEVGSAPLVPV